MRRGLAFFVTGLCIVVPQLAVAEVRNPANGHHYRVVNDPPELTWAGANAAAQTYTYLGVTGHLVTISSPEEQEFVKSMLVPPAPGLATFWIGARSVSPPDGTSFEWVTGEPFSYTNWWSGVVLPEPNDNGFVMCNHYDSYLPLDCERGQWFLWGINAPRAWQGGIGFIVEFDTTGIADPLCVAPPSGIAGWWPGDGNTTDIVGGHDGTLQGTATFASPALVGDGFRFPAEGDSVRVPSDAALEPAAGLTVEAWVRAVRPGSWKFIVSKGAVPGEDASFALSTGNLETALFYVRGDTETRGGALSADSSLFWNGDWHHLVGRYDGGSVLLFVDGNIVGGEYRTLQPINYNLSDRDLYIGRAPGVANSTFPGDIDEVVVYNRALSADEIWYLYLNESVRRCKGPSAPTLPVVGVISAPLDPRLVGTPVSASATFTDAGVTDTHTAIWEWGDGSTSTAVITESGGSGLATGTHSYAVPGVYRIRLTVADQGMASGEGSFEYVVVYDPGAGFVTGGGWISSPLGAYKPNPGLSGKASFGFVSKYQHGANVPSGDTQFLFHAADMKFKSTTYQWLVVAGSRAQFKGHGSINGVGDLEFLLTAIDGKKTPGEMDRFRIKIWDANTSQIVYDNQTGASDNSDPTTTLGGGSIVIHD